MVDNITRVYPVVKEMGFEGIVYDNEGYYSGVMILPDGKTRASRLWDQQDQVCERTTCARRVEGGRGREREGERARDEETDRARDTRRETERQGELVARQVYARQTEHCCCARSKDQPFTFLPRATRHCRLARHTQTTEAATTTLVGFKLGKRSQLCGRTHQSAWCTVTPGPAS